MNQLAVAVMKEVGIDISHKKAQTVFSLPNKGALFSYVITVCDESSAEQCPVFPGPAKRLHWSFPDPSQLKGTEEEQLAKLRIIRDDIKAAIESWYAELATQ